MTTATAIRELTERFRRARSIDERLDVASQIRNAVDEWGWPSSYGMPGRSKLARPAKLDDVSVPGFVGPTDVCSRLLAVSAMHQRRELTDEEFQEAKKRIIGMN